MSRDPIVEEVRAARDAIARQHEYDLQAIFASLREMETEDGKETVRLPPREPSTVEPDRPVRRGS
jgi:hypothetical protein